MENQTMTVVNLIRPELLTLTAEQFSALVPYFIMFAGMLLAIVFSVFRKLSPTWWVVLTSVGTCIASIYATTELFHNGPVSLFDGMMVADAFSHYFNVVFLAATALWILASVRYLDKEALQHPEYYVLMLMSALGMMLMTSAQDLVVLFIALEIMSLAVYVLVGFRRADRRSNEASVKYFIMGGAASAVMLYGVALLYGATGSMNVRVILDAIVSNPTMMSAMFTVGAWLVTLGFLFKVASVPFHSWMPDVYEGAPAPVTGFMTTGLKAAAFAAFVRVFSNLGYGQGLAEGIQAHLHDILWVCAVLTMVIGNVIALTQTNLKRMLAYSSIAHTGYLLVGILTGPFNEQGFAPVVVYLVGYAVMNLGAFVILSMISGKDDRGLNLHELSGLSQRHPWLAFALAVFLFSMAGVPPTAGFAAKYLLFYSAVQAGEIALVVIAVLSSAVSVYYYLRVLVFAYMKDPVDAQAQAPRFSVLSAIAVGLMVVITFQVGVLPTKLIAAAQKAVASLKS
jgi:NADH-quinone oxidoreductase subunit N